MCFDLNLLTKIVEIFKLCSAMYSFWKCSCDGRFSSNMEKFLKMICLCMSFANVWLFGLKNVDKYLAYVGIV